MEEESDWWESLKIPKCPSCGKRNIPYKGSCQACWRRAKTIVKERDDYTCQNCGCTVKEVLLVHHKLKENNEDYTDIENMITLCFNCHHPKHIFNLTESQRQIILDKLREDRGLP